MIKVLIALLAVAVLVPVSVPIGMKVLENNTSEIVDNKSYIQQSVPKYENTLTDEKSLKKSSAPKILILESKNTVSFRGPVTSGSMSYIMNRLQKISETIPKNEEIYLVIDSPGGSVFDGLAFIDYAQAIPQKVNTVTLFGASMAFHIAQNLDTRYISVTGTMMSHRARGGVDGQFDGELESRYKMVKRVLDYMDLTVANRMKMDLKEYKEMIKPEYWVHGFDAVGEKAADEKVLVRCGKSLSGTEVVALDTLFGSANVEFSKCPLIKAPVSVSFKAKDSNSLNYLKYLYELSFLNKKLFIEEMIYRDKLKTSFPIK